MHWVCKSSTYTTLHIKKSDTTNGCVVDTVISDVRGQIFYVSRFIFSHCHPFKEEIIEFLRIIVAGGDLVKQTTTAVGNL
jgi:hypothetical protein